MKTLTKIYTLLFLLIGAEAALFPMQNRKRVFSWEEESNPADPMIDVDDDTAPMVDDNQGENITPAETGALWKRGRYVEGIAAVVRIRPSIVERWAFFIRTSGRGVPYVKASLKERAIALEEDIAFLQKMGFCECPERGWILGK